MTRNVFRVHDGGVVLGGWSRDGGLPVLMLHGGPGMSYAYMDDLVAEVPQGWAVASFQQRGLEPSGGSGPFEVRDHVEDARRVLDALGWERAVVVGHSWGGHLALHIAAALPDRTLAVLAVDPLGAVGDGGARTFETELAARTPEEVRARAEELDERAMRGEGSEADALESFRLVWPAYFPSWDQAPTMPPMSMSVPCYAETWSSLERELPRLEAALPAIAAPVGFVAGTRSPVPLTASTDTAERIPGAWVTTVEGAGHFPWLDAPGCVRPALERLAEQASVG